MPDSIRENLQLITSSTEASLSDLLEEKVAKQMPHSGRMGGMM